MKNLVLLTVLLITILILPKTANAAETARPSAKLAVISSGKAEDTDIRKVALKNIFKKYNSPLADSADAYIKYADENGVDWELLPAISGVESTFGKALPGGSYNAYGWGNGKIYFTSWEDGIKVIEQALRQNYINRGARNVWSIGPIYAASPTWSVRVDSFMSEINREYQRLSVMTPNI